MKSILRPLLLYSVIAVLGAGVWLLIGADSVGSTVSVGEGATHLDLTVMAGRKVNLSVVVFSAAKHQMRVVSQSIGDKKKHLADVAVESKAIAVCNGGYFDTKKFVPSGLEIAQGVSIGHIGSSGASGAVFGVKGGVPFIADEKKFQLTPDVTDLVQCGPLLMGDGAVYHDTGSAKAPRTFVMTDGRDKWAIGTSEPLTLTELASALAKPGFIKDFEVKSAMNLDGGPSTGLWWRDAAGKGHDQRERWSVRNMIVVVPK